MPEPNKQHSDPAGSARSPSRLMQMASAFHESCILFTASDTGLFKVLDELGSADCDTLAQRCNLNRRGTELLANACAALGLVDKLEDGNYRNRPDVAAFLVPGKPGDISQAIRYNRDVYPAWGKLEELVLTGRPVEAPALHLGEDESRTRDFVMSMHNRAMAIGRSVIPFLDLAECRQLLDVGGGSGAYSILAAQTYPELKATVLDLPEVVKIADELIRDSGLSARVKVQPGDYRKTTFPQNNDAIFFFGMLHQESVESIRSLIAQAWQALMPGGKIYVLDMMTDKTHCSPRFSALFAVNMALTTEHGWVFSDQELNDWLTEAGFIDIQTQACPPPMPHWLVSARKP